MLAEEEKALNLKAKNLVLKREEQLQEERELEQKQKKRRLMRLHIKNILESFPFIGVVCLLAFVMGGIVFINVPEGVGCRNNNVLCQQFRLRQPKVNYGD